MGVAQREKTVRARPLRRGRHLDHPGADVARVGLDVDGLEGAVELHVAEGHVAHAVAVGARRHRSDGHPQPEVHPDVLH